MLGRQAHAASVDFKGCFPWPVVACAKELLAPKGCDAAAAGEAAAAGGSDTEVEPPADAEEECADDDVQPVAGLFGEEEEEISDNFTGGRQNAQLAGGDDADPAKLKGTSRIFACKNGDKKAVGEGDLYRYRGVHLRQLSYDEWSIMVELKKYKTEESPDLFLQKLKDFATHARDRVRGTRGPGRPANPKFPFPAGHPLGDEWYQELVSKLPCNKIYGRPPPREPRELPVGQTPSKAWLRAQQVFAEYILCVYMPWEVEVRSDAPIVQVYPSLVGPGLPSSPGGKPELSANALRAWLSQLRAQASVGDATDQQCIADARSIARGRLFLLHNVCHTLYVSVPKKVAGNKLRARHRATWSSEEAKQLAGIDGGGGADGGDPSADAQAEKLINDYVTDMERRRLSGDRLKAVQQAEVWVATMSAEAVGDVPSAGAGMDDSFAAAYESEYRKQYPVGLREGALLEVKEDVLNKVVKAVDEGLPDASLEDAEEVGPAANGAALPEGWIPSEFHEISDEEFAKLRETWLRGNAALLEGWKVECMRARRLRKQPPRPKLPLPPLNRLQREFSRRLIPALLHMRRARARGEERATYASNLDPTDLWHLLHGPAGTGKSVLLAVLAKAMKEHHLGGIVASAYTGVAAAPLVRAGTLCTMSGLPPAACHRQVGDYEAPTAKHIKRFEQYAGKCEALSVLFIDEISFNGPLFLHHLSVRFQHFLGNDLPFGGIVVILGGDFFQLPPCNAPQLCSAVVDQALFQHLPKAEQDQQVQQECAKEASKKQKGAAKKRATAPGNGAVGNFGAGGDSTLGAGGDGDGVEARPSRFDTMSACARGTDLFTKFRRLDLKQPMRTDPNEQQFAAWLGRFRDTDEARPVPRALLQGLKPVSPADRQSVLWRFAPHGVLSNRERVHLNAAQVLQWAKYHGVPVFKWKLPLSGIVAQALSEEEMARLYEDEPALWGYFCIGCPCMLTRNVNPLLGLANGSSATHHSLTFGAQGTAYTTSDGRSGRLGGGHPPPDFGYCTVVLKDLPRAVNVCPELDDAQRERYGDGQSLSAKEASIVVPILFNHKPSKDANKVDLVSLYAAMLGLDVCVKANMHMVELAFAVTDYKLQGKTLDRLVLSLGPRPFKPCWKLSGLYVLLSRVRKLDGLRLSQKVSDWSHLLEAKGMRHGKNMQLWEQAYDDDGWFVPKKAAAEQVVINKRIAAAQATKRAQGGASNATAARGSKRTKGTSDAKPASKKRASVSVKLPAPSAKRSMGSVPCTPSALAETAPVAVGLVNHGNTCYASTIVQLIYGIPSVRDGMLALPANNKCAITKALGVVLHGLHDGRGPVETLPLLVAMGLSGDVQTFKEHDADECLQWLRRWPEEGPGERLMRGALGGAQTYEQHLACGCDHDSKSEPFTGLLGLNLPTGGTLLTMEEVLAWNYQEQVLCGKEQVRCELHGLQDARRKPWLHYAALPRVLGIRLSRFIFSEGVPLKDDRPVEITASLSASAVVEGHQPASYTLLAVALHHGHHYKSLVRGAAGVWHSFDDEGVLAIPEAEVLRLATAHAYLLLYQRTEPLLGASSPGASRAKRKRPHEVLQLTDPPQSWQSQLLDAGIMEMLVDGDNNCAYYAILDRRRDGTVQHKDNGCVTATRADKDTARAKRATVANWLLSDAATAYRNTACDRLVCCTAFGCEAVDVMEDPHARDMHHTLSRSCSCPTSGLRANSAGIEFLTKYPQWAGQDVLKVLATLEQTDLVVIDTSEPVSDTVRVYLADGVSRNSVYCSWASVVQPRLRQQQEGNALGHQEVRELETDARRVTRVVRPVRPMRVLVYNGGTHYNATRCAAGTPGNPHLLKASTTAVGNRCKHHNFKVAAASPVFLPVPCRHSGCTRLLLEVDPGGLTNVGSKLHQQFPTAHIGTMVAGDSGRPGGACGDGTDMRFLRANHLTQEEDVVSNWLLTCKHNRGGGGETCTREFSETIAERWGLLIQDSIDTSTRQGVDYSKALACDYSDAWTVSQAHLSAKSVVPNEFDYSMQYPTTLCFVAGPNVKARDTAIGSMSRTLNTQIGDYDVFRAAVKCALAAGLRAMAAEGCTIALVAGVSTGVYAGQFKQQINADFSAIVNEILTDTHLSLGARFEKVVYTTLG